jgi:hypothetical protein
MAIVDSDGAPDYNKDELKYLQVLSRARKDGTIGEEEYAQRVKLLEGTATARTAAAQATMMADQEAALGKMAQAGKAPIVSAAKREMEARAALPPATPAPAAPAAPVEAPRDPLARMLAAQGRADQAAIGTRGMTPMPMGPSDRVLAAMAQMDQAAVGSRGMAPLAMGPSDRRLSAMQALADAEIGTRGLTPIAAGPVPSQPGNPFLTLAQAADDARAESLARMSGGTMMPSNPAMAMSRAANVGGQLASQGMGSTPAAKTWMQIQDARAEAVQRAASQMRAPGVGYKTVLNKADDLSDADRAVRSVLNTRANDDWIMGGPLGNSRRVTPLTADDIVGGRVGTGTPGSVAQLASAVDEGTPANPRAFTPGLTRALTALGSKSPAAARGASWLAAHPKIAGGGTAAAGVAAGMVARPLVDALNIGGEDSYWDNVLTGGAGMAATGAGVGSFFGPMGALAGGALGGGIGMLASGLSYKGSAGSQFSKEANKLAQQLTTTADALGLSGEARAELNEQFLTAQALANADPKNPNIELLRQSYGTLLAQLPSAKQRQTRTSSTAANALATQAAISQYARPYVDGSVESAKFRANALNSLANSVGQTTGMGDSLRARAIDAETYGRDIANSWARSLAVAPTIQAMNENLDYYNATGQAPNAPYFTLTAAG